jgi:hypothetical protein
VSLAQKGNDMEQIELKYCGVRAQLAAKQQEQQEINAMKEEAIHEIAICLDAFVLKEHSIVTLIHGEVKRLVN